MDEEKTLRKPSTDDAEKTLRKPSNDLEKTLRKPASEDSEKTLRKPSIESSKDSGDSLDKTIAINRNPPTDNSQGNQLDSYDLNGKKYTFKKIISESTGEGQIYLVENNANIFVLKLYYPQFNPKKELLEILKSINFPGVIKLYDYGVWTSPQGSKRSFELMEFLEGQTLDEVFFVRDANKLRDIALQAAHALTFCHNNRILHKDIKPGNFFFRDKGHTQLVLGDFGIASLCSEEEMMHQTQQARTPIYAAPEMYETIDDKVEIDGKVDFYSLGILLMYIWLGGNPFKDNERRMIRMKRYAELPYPADVPADILTLMQGLTIVDPVKRWGFEEVQRWHKGESVAVSKNTAARYKPYIFDADNNHIANNPQELAVLMDKNPSLAIKYLYSKRITKWLEDCGNTKLAVELEEILEKRYPKNQEAGLRASVYLLDEKATYKSVDGVICDSLEKMAEAFVNNQEHYAKALKNPDDDFYLYLQAFGNTKERDLFVNYFKKNDAKIALWKTIYYLDETTPFWLEVKKTKSKNGYELCNTPDEVIIAFRENDITSDAWDSFIDGRFTAWYATQNDPDTLQTIESIIADQSVSLSVQVHAILFNLNRQVSFTLYLPGENDNQYYFSKNEIGNLFNHYARRKYQEKEKNTYIDMCLDSLGSNHNILHFYLLSKNWTSEDKWVKYCFEMNSADNKKKCGPYNKPIATYKTIKGLGFAPYYHFPKSDKYVYSLEEMTEIPQAEILTELENGELKNWLATFYQENPEADLKPKGAYEKLTRRYIEKITELDKNCPESARFDEAIQITESTRKKVKINYESLRWMKILFGVLFFAPSLLLLAGLIVYKIPLTENPLPGGFWKVSFLYWLIASILLGIYTWRANGDGGFVTNWLAGLMEAFILYYIIYFIVALLYPFVTIISIVLVIAAIGGFVWMAYGGISSSRSLRKELFIKYDPETSFIEPLYHAFHPGKNGFRSSKSDALENFNTDLARQRKKLFSWILPGIVTFFLFLPIFFVLHPHFAENPFRKNMMIKVGLVMSDEQKTKMAGTWTGTFDDRPSTLTIEPFVSDSINTTLSVKYKKTIEEQLKGVFNFREKKLNLTDIVKNKKLDGNYEADIVESLDTIRGWYRNQQTRKSVKFEFVKSVEKPQE